MTRDGRADLGGREDLAVGSDWGGRTIIEAGDFGGGDRGGGR